MIDLEEVQLCITALANMAADQSSWQLGKVTISEPYIGQRVEVVDPGGCTAYSPHYRKVTVEFSMEVEDE